MNGLTKLPTTPKLAKFLPRAARSAVAAALLLGLATGARAGQATNDVVQTKDGKSLSGTVVEETYTELKFKEGNKAQRSIKWEDVLSIRYGHSEYSSVADRLGSASAEESLAGLDRLKADAKLKAPIKQQVLFQIASLKARVGDVDGSVAAWQELLKAFPGGRFLDSAARGVVEANLAKNAAGEATKALDQAVSEARSAEPGPRFDATVALLRARILETQGNFAGAKKAYEEAEKSGPLAADQAAARDLGIAFCQQNLGQGADSEARYRKIVTAPEAPRYVLSGAWNGIGDLYLEKGKKERNSDTLMQALYSYLRGVVLYLPLEGEPMDQQRRAYDGAIQACTFIAEVDANAKATYKQRATELTNRRAQIFGK